MFEVKRGILRAETFNVLAESVGWGHPPIEQVKIAIENSIYTVCVEDDKEIIAMGRMIGDNSMSYFIKDVAVMPSYQGKGVGKLLIADMLSFIKDKTPKSWKVCVELISASEKEGFYEKFAFQRRPSATSGSGMSLMVEK